MANSAQKSGANTPPRSSPSKKEKKKHKKEQEAEIALHPSLGVLNTKALFDSEVPKAKTAEHKQERDITAHRRSSMLNKTPVSNKLTEKASAIESKEPTESKQSKEYIEPKSKDSSRRGSLLNTVQRAKLEMAKEAKEMRRGTL